MKDVIPLACPICNSMYDWVKVDENRGGYSFGKGAVGAALFGPVGAVAGIGGKKMVTYKCKKCGHSHSYKQ